MEGVGIVEAFANCDSALSLVLGSFFTLVFIFIFYLVRKVIRFNEFCESFTIGIKAMIPAIMILCLAWTLSGICSADYLNIGGYVGSVVGGSALVGALMPGHHVPGSLWSGIFHRYILGYVWNPDSNRLCSSRR